MEQTDWHVTAEQGNLEEVYQVWQWAKEKLTTEEINNKLLFAADCREQTDWHFLSIRGNLKLLQNYGSGVEKLTTEEINKIYV